MSIVPYDGSPTRLERFSSLQAGQYWRATEDMPEQGIRKGLVLLIKSIRWVDGAMHTVILRPHPDLIGKQFSYVTSEEGKERRRTVAYGEHRFLVGDFENLFVFEPDAQRVRNEELMAVQGRIAALQAELVQGQSDPSVMEEEVERVLREDAEKAAGEPATAGSIASPTAPGTPATRPDVDVVALSSGGLIEAVRPGLTGEGVERMKDAARREHRIATIRASWIQERTQAISATIAAMTPYYEEQAAAALATTEEVRDHVAKLIKGIESLDLYVGKDVDVLTVREGVHAPRDEPLTFVQRKLFMDEELAVFADVDARFDHRDHERFFEALREHDELVRQVFPTERCVLVMATTRRYVRYDDPYASAVRNEMNRQVFLLVRNGMNVHRVHSPVETHLKAARLFPSQSQQDSIFRGFDGSKIRFEDVAFTDSLRRHDDFALHYKRFLILACGLDHRLGLFGEFYEGPPSMSFVTQEFQDAHCRFLFDDDASRLLPGQARPNVDEWIEGRNAYLRPGSRVLCNWAEAMNPDTAPAACKSRGGFEENFDRPYKPTVPTGFAIAYRSGTSTCVDVEVRGRARASGDERTFKAKVDLTLLPNSRWGCEDTPYLCLDAVEPEDLEWYIHNRAERRNHLGFIRFFKKALAFVRAERVMEAPARARLAKALEDGRIGTPGNRAALVSQAVTAWRAAHRGAAIPEAEGGAGWRELLDQMFALADQGSRAEAAAALARSLGYAPLRLVLDGKGRYQLYAAPSEAERDDRLSPHAWAHLITLKQATGGFAQSSRAWAILPSKAASETTLHEWPDAEGWRDLQTPFRTPSSKAAFLDAAGALADRIPDMSRRCDPAAFEAMRAEWLAARKRANANSSYVRDPNIAFPFAARLRRGEPRLLCVVATAHAVLHAIAPDDGARQRLRDDYVSIYRHAEVGGERFDAAVAGPVAWWPGETPLPKGPVTSLYDLDAAGGGFSSLDERSAYDPRIDPWFDRWIKAKPSRIVHVAPAHIGEAGGISLDARLGIRLPDDYAPTRAESFTLSRHGGKEPRFPRFVELTPYDPEAPRKERDMDRFRDMGPDNAYDGFGSTSRVCGTLAEARAYARSEAGEGFKAVRAEDIVDAPQPPDGVERWYLVKATPSG